MKATSHPDGFGTNSVRQCKFDLNVQCKRVLYSGGSIEAVMSVHVAM